MLSGNFGTDLVILNTKISLKKERDLSDVRKVKTCYLDRALKKYGKLSLKNPAYLPAVNIIRKEINRRASWAAL